MMFEPTAVPYSRKREITCACCGEPIMTEMTYEMKKGYWCKNCFDEWAKGIKHYTVDLEEDEE